TSGRTSLSGEADGLLADGPIIEEVEILPVASVRTFPSTIHWKISLTTAVPSMKPTLLALLVCSPCRRTILRHRLSTYWVFLWKASYGIGLMMLVKLLPHLPIWYNGRFCLL